jgi:hypothetical protein
MGGQQKNFISDIVFFQHQDGMQKKVRRHFLQCVNKESKSFDLILFELRVERLQVRLGAKHCHGGWGEEG